MRSFFATATYGFFCLAICRTYIISGYEDMDSTRVKVVAHLIGGGLVKGYLQDESFGPALAPLHELPSLHGEVTLDVVNDGGERTLKLAYLKALFFVKTFDGSREHSEIKFFDKTPPRQGLWVRLKFSDGEVTEGIIHNSLQYVNDTGFFMKPSDSLCNTSLTYVVKTALTGFQIIGFSDRV